MIESICLAMSSRVSLMVNSVYQFYVTDVLEQHHISYRRNNKKKKLFQKGNQAGLKIFCVSEPYNQAKSLTQVSYPRKRHYMNYSVSLSRGKLVTYHTVVC